jgi:hypothetical protein
VRSMLLDDPRQGGSHHDLPEPSSVRTENRFREWAAIVMDLANGWKARMEEARRQHDKAHNGVRNPFTIEGVKAVQPVKPGGEANQQLAEMWPAVIAMLGPRRRRE